MNNNWLNSKSWDPTLLVDKRPITQASQEEPVEPEVRRLSTAHESEYSYFDWLYTGYELGGEG